MLENKGDDYMDFTFEKPNDTTYKIVFEKIKNLIENNVDEIAEIRPLDEKTGCTCLLITQDKKEIILSLI